MRKIKFFILIIFLSFLGACVKDNGTEILEEPILNPTASKLVAPENGLVCYTARPNNDNYAEVDFEWQATENTEYYQLQITNLLYDYNFTEKVNTNKKSYSLLRGNPYAWKIISVNSKATKTAESETWKFYLNSEGIKNYAPFAAEIIAPESGKTVSPINGKITLEWKGTDPDNDDLEFEIFISKIKDEVLNLSIEPITSANPTIEIPVDANSTYYWRIKSSDETSSTYSTIYAFRTK